MESLLSTPPSGLLPVFIFAVGDGESPGPDGIAG